MNAVAVLVALALDATLREPPLAVHPVRGIGRLLDGLGRWAPAAPPVRAATRGALAWTVGVSTATALALGIERGIGRLPSPLDTVGRGVALWPLLSLAMLTDAVAAVECHLTAGVEPADGAAVAEDDLAAARRAVARLVSRDVSRADAVEVRTAAISSLAENVADSLIAPLVWFAGLGLPGAAAYRFVNTADAMWGYRDERWRHAGTFAARADDLANLVPARVAGIVLALGGTSLRDLRREARRTPSPNGGWPMAALALQLGIRCAKPDSYVLNASGRAARGEDIARALRLVRGRGLAAAILLALACREPVTEPRGESSTCAR